MTPKAKRNASSAGKANGEGRPIVSSTVASADADSLEISKRHEKIRCRAYEIYLERGSEPGRELDNWLQAEREIDGVASLHSMERVPDSVG